MHLHLWLPNSQLDWLLSKVGEPALRRLGRLLLHGYVAGGDTSTHTDGHGRDCPTRASRPPEVPAGRYRATTTISFTAASLQPKGDRV